MNDESHPMQWVNQQQRAFDDAMMWVRPVCLALVGLGLIGLALWARFA